jgi:hypothetical protein
MYFVTLFGVALVTTAALALDAEARDGQTVKIDSLPIAANFKLVDAGVTLPERDRARFKALVARGEGAEGVDRRESVGLKNTAVSMVSLSGGDFCGLMQIWFGQVHYMLSVGVGSPPTYCESWIEAFENAPLMLWHFAG